MADDPGQPSTQVPWPLRIWPLAVTAVAVTTALVLLAALIDSDVSRVALPVIAGAAGTIALAVVTVRRISPRDWLDAFQLPCFFLVVRCSVQVECELAVEPGLRGGAERLGQPQCGREGMPRRLTRLLATQ